MTVVKIDFDLDNKKRSVKVMARVSVENEYKEKGGWKSSCDVEHDR